MTTVPYIPSNQRVDWPWADVQQLPGGAGVPPGRIGFGAAGKGFDLSGDLHSASVRRIRRCYDADGQIGVEFESAHPFETGELLPCRVGGIDMATMRAHRANNWAGGPLVHVNKLSTDLEGTAGVRLGGDPWTVTRVDARKLILDGSVWKTDAAHPDPIMWSGVMYRELVDAWPTLQEALEYIDGRPGGITLGMGYFALLATDADTLLPQADFTLTGAGMELSYLHRGDYFNAIPFKFEHNNFRVAHLTQDGNRPFQKQATHGWKVTTPASEDESVFDGTFEHVRSQSIPGYGGNHGHPGGKVRIRWLHCKTIGTGNDGKDFKGAQSTNPDGSYGGTILDDYSAWNGLGTAGTNRQEPILLGNNPIATTNGSHAFTVALNSKIYTGAKFIFGDDVPDVGGLDFAGKPFQVVSRSGLVVTCTHESAATSTVAAGGGAGVTILLPLLLKGKPGNDIRGEGWTLSGLKVGREMFLSTGCRIRGGNGENNNGSGGHYTVLDGLVVENTGADEYGVGGAKGLAVMGDGVQVSNATLRSNGAGTAVIVGSTASLASLRNIHVDGWYNGLNLIGNDNDVDLTAVDCERAVYNDGGKVTVEEEFEDAIDVTTGSTIATFHWPAHGLTVGKKVVFDGVKAHNIGGVIIDDGAEYTIASVPDADSFTFDTGQYPAVDVTGGGGDEISVTVNGVNNYAFGNRVAVRVFECAHAIVCDNKVSGLRIERSTWDKNGTGLTLDTLTTGIQMGPGNTGFSDAVPFGKTITAANAGAGALVTISDSNTSTRGATVAAGGANVVLARSDGTNWLVV